MGHDHHFLSRLDRVPRDQVDFALALYRDHERTGWILSRASLPPEVERVALAIEEDDRGPHVIVTRDGHFVTCLGPGMSTGSHPVIVRRRLDFFSREYDTQVERKALRDRLEDERRAHGTMGSIFDRLLFAGPTLSREELLGLAAFAPLMTPTYGEVLRDELKGLLDIVVAATPVLAHTRKAESLSGPVVALLAPAGRAYWSIMHTVVLYAMHAREMIEQTPEIAGRVADLLFLVPVIGGLSCSVLRSAWAIGKIGRVLLPACKHRWETASTRIEIYTAAAALASLGLRHQRLEAEVKKALAAPRADRPDDPFLKWVGDVALVAFDPATVDAVREERTVAQVVDETVGEWSISRMCLYDSMDDLLQVSAMLPFFARAEAEHLYLPRERARKNTWDESDSCWMMARQYEASRRQVPAPEGPSRSGPCPCGSGKKYKRCCARGS